MSFVRCGLRLAVGRANDFVLSREPRTLQDFLLPGFKKVGKDFQKRPLLTFGFSENSRESAGIDSYGC